jgi:Glycosyltransferases, probably involved in cell wall biogenesis
MTTYDIIMYVWLFASLFFEVFLLITYFEIREELKKEKIILDSGPNHFPSVTVVVPCYNEEKTVIKTIESLLALDYPKDKLHLLVVNDGSTDNTLRVVEEQFSNHEQIEIHSKENGGKHSALNFAISKTMSELISCLDADSFVDQDALKRMVPLFENKEIMAVIPSVKIWKPKSILQHIQKVEYSWGIFLRRLLSSLNALYVTPGPFSVFRANVFKELGGYKHAHHTEDMEMAMRMQRHGYKIVNSHSAFVYTVGPEKLRSLYKQRVRWTYGFLNNVIDYKEMLFNKKFGNIGLLVLPIATVSVFAIIYMSVMAVIEVVNKIGDEYLRFEAVGWSYSIPNFGSIEWFAINLGSLFFISLTILLLTIFIMYLSLRLSDGKFKFTRGILYYFFIYIFIVPFWLTKATYSTITKQSITWR